MKVRDFRRCLDDIERIYGEEGSDFDVVIKTDDGVLHGIHSTLVADKLRAEWGTVISDRGIFGLEIGDDLELPRLIIRPPDDAGRGG